MNRLPQIAVRETRTIAVPPRHPALPPGEYAFVEHYCPDPRCDCRRVLLQVWRRDKKGEVFATLQFGWEKLGFYAKKMAEDDARALKGGRLDPLNPQSDLAPALLNVFREMIETDSAYVKRLQRHYELFRKTTA